MILIVMMLAGCSSAGAAASDSAARARHRPTPRLAVIDWGLAQDLVAMGVMPVGIGDTRGYATWVAQPGLPAGRVNLGARSRPNLEVLAALHPDKILITTFYAQAASRLKQIAPVVSVNTYGEPGDIWSNMVAAVNKLGRIAKRPAAAAAFIQRVDKNIQQAARHLPAHTRPLLLIEFLDAEHVLVYGKGSLVQATMQRMGLTNAWQGKTDLWGTAEVPLSRLADISSAQVIVVGPIPVGVPNQIDESRVWHSLPAVQDAPVLFIPAVWNFGGLPSATRFARLIGQALNQAPAQGPGWPAKAVAS